MAQRGAQSTTDDPRIEKLLSQLTLEEKLSLLGGTGFETKPIPRLGIPPLNMTDGPVGVRWEPSSAFPVGAMMAAGWNPELIQKLGAALGREAKAKGRHMLLAPCVNIQRVPHGGRNFESFSEDPYLASRMAVAYVKGVQSEHVVATTKHYACNNQEHERDFTNVTVSERALREIYLPAFEAAVTEAGSMSVMSAYNKVNGAWCSENPPLLTDILKGEWQFRGFVVSDWGAVHSTVATANAGLDVEMPTGVYLNPDSLMPAIKAGKVSEEVITDKVRRLLRTMVWAGLFDGAEKDKGALNTDDHKALALAVAREGIVLLKNDGQVLPVDRNRVKSIAMIGPNAAVARTGGGGSSKVDPIFATDPLTSLAQKAGGNIRVSYAKGCPMEGEIQPIEPSALVPAGGAAGEHGLKAEYFTNQDLSGAPAVTRIDSQVNFEWHGGSPDPSIPNDRFSARWTGSIVPPKSATYRISVMSDDGVRLYLDGRLVADNWSDHAAETRTVTVPMEKDRKYEIKVEYFENKGSAIMKLGWESTDEGLLAQAVDLAKKSDMAFLCVGLSSAFESEGFDRQTLELPEEQVALIKAVAAANRNTVVVLNSGAPVLMETWIKEVPALVEAWYPGEEGGDALADVLLGDVNPSGKLPATFLRRWEDSPAYGNYPGKGAVNYAEGIFVGYRHFDRQNIDVQFPFGHGLSYTTFAYANLVVSPVKKVRPAAITVSVDIKNTGKRAGAEVAQLYVHDVQSSVERPPKELKGFQKVFLKPGETRRVTFHLDDRSFAYYNVDQKGWTVEPGKFEILVGSSSRDIRAKGNVTID